VADLKEVFLDGFICVCVFNNIWIDFVWAQTKELNLGPLITFLNVAMKRNEIIDPVLKVYFLNDKFYYF
jgi:hypothetical protein